jgi:hypothetical protein
VDNGESQARTMPASLARTDLQVTQADRPRNNAGSLVSFTRHKDALARLVALQAPAAVRFVLHVLLTHADVDGVCWTGIDTIREAMPRSAARKVYHRRTVELALVAARRLGLLTWTRVPPLSRYPAPDRSTHRAVMGKGRWTQSGGRIWRLNLPALRGQAPPLSNVGTESGGHDLQIVSGYDLQIGSSDPLVSLRETLKEIPRTPQAAAPASAARTGNTPPSSQSFARAPATRAPEKKASETPRAPAAARASRPAAEAAGRPRTGSETEKALQGDGRGDGQARREPSARVGPAEIEAFARSLQRPGRPNGGP